MPACPAICPAISEKSLECSKVLHFSQSLLPEHQTVHFFPFLKALPPIPYVLETNTHEFRGGVAAL